MTALDEELFTAAREGRSEEVLGLIEAGADPNAVDPGDRKWGGFLRDITPLMVAAGSPRSDAATLRALLEGGALLEKTSATGVSAVWYAAGGLGFNHKTRSHELEEGNPYLNWGGGDVERLRLLLDAGANPNETAVNGRTCVVEACKAGDAERLALLIERGASIVAGKRKGRYETYAVPLFRAAEAGSAECVQLLVQHGFPVGFTCQRENALHSALTVEVAELLWNAGARIGRRRWPDPIDKAFLGKRYDVAEFLLSKVSAGTKRDEYLNAKLFNVAAISGNIEPLQMLLRLGADVNAYSRGRGTPLHYACWPGDGAYGIEDSARRESIAHLISAGAEVNRNLPERGTPLHDAVSGDWESPTAARVLLEHGAEVDAVDSNGITPLMVAACKGSLHCVRLLLDSGADRKRKGPRGKTALDAAQRHLETWQSIVAEAPSSTDSKEEAAAAIERHQEARSEAEAICEMLED